MIEQCAGQQAFPLWQSLHPCPVCEVDRIALGHALAELPTEAPYTMEDLVAHLGSCSTGTFADEIDCEEPF